MSISLGSPRRDKTVRLELLETSVKLVRMGTGGDERRARRLFREQDGCVDAFGVGGTNLHITTPWRHYPLHSGLRLVRDVRKTPYTDGRVLQAVLEAQVIRNMEKKIGSLIPRRNVFLVEAASSYGMLLSFLEAGYECVFGDLMFALGLPIPLRTKRGLDTAIRCLLPVVGRLPIRMLYSTGKSQHYNQPRYMKYFQECDVIAGDFLYIRRHLPPDMQGKVVVTNTTTPEDVAFLKSRGIRFLVTTTPVFEGRSFGTNALEAALIAAAGKGRPLTNEEMKPILSKAGIGPVIRDLEFGGKGAP